MGWPGGVRGIAADFGTGPGGLSTSRNLGLGRNGNNLNPSRLPGTSAFDLFIDIAVGALKSGIAWAGGLQE